MRDDGVSGAVDEVVETGGAVAAVQFAVRHRRFVLGIVAGEGDLPETQDRLGVVGLGTGEVLLAPQMKKAASIQLIIFLISV